MAATAGQIGGWLLVLAVGLVGAWLGILAAGTSSVAVGPVDTTMVVRPSFVGDSVIEVPPLGTLSIDSHDGPLALGVKVEGLNLERARAIVADPSSLTGIEDRVVDGVREGIVWAAGRGFVVGVLGAAILSAAVFRQPRRVIVAVTATALVFAGSFGVAALTVNERALAQPRFTGLLTGAQSLIGNVETIADDFEVYRKGLAKIVTNVSRLYQVTSTLPTYEPANDVVKVLHVSDLHVAPQAWDVISAVVEQYDVDVVVDTGDTTHLGTSAENSYLEPIGELSVPYVWVRGNHDSATTMAAMEEIPTVVVLDGQPQDVEGIRFVGAGDPRFTPDQGADNTADAVAAQAVALARVAERDGAVDVIVYHDPTVGALFDGVTPLVLSGHMHTRANVVYPEGTRVMTQGTTGGASFHGVDEEEPVPIELSVLYLDRTTDHLQAWDDITLGGLGLTSAEIERHVVGEEEEPVNDEPTPTPTGPIPPTPVSTPTVIGTFPPS